MENKLNWEDHQTLKDMRRLILGYYSEGETYMNADEYTDEEIEKLKSFIRKVEEEAYGRGWDDGSKGVYVTDALKAQRG